VHLVGIIIRKAVHCICVRFAETPTLCIFQIFYFQVVTGKLHFQMFLIPVVFLYLWLVF
jgi:hypothetical protein